MAALTAFFLACHPNAGGHMADFKSSLDKQGVATTFLAADKAYDAAVRRGSSSVERISSEHAKAVALRLHQSADRVIADVGSEFSALVFQELDALNSKVVKIAYYDNPEPFVPGGYSATAAAVIRAADGVLFANAALAKETIYDGDKKPLDLSAKKRHGLGYFAFEKLEEYRQQRLGETRPTKRAEFFAKAGLEDRGQKLLVFLGGANETYEKQVLPALGEIFREASLDKSIVVLQRHPRASDADCELFEALPANFVLSPMDFDSALVMADQVAYYQTSASVYFPLMGLPAIQLGHEPYEDLLIRNALCSFAGTADGLTAFLQAEKSSTTAPEGEELQTLYRLIGADPHWAKHLAEL